MPNQRARVTISASVDPAETWTEEFDGAEHLVAPIIMLVEGVHAPGNANQPELALASEFGRYDGVDWNGRPVVLGHPQIDGTFVSANIPSVLQSEQFGCLFNTRVEDKKLKSEIWINIDRVKELDREDITNRVNAIQRGEVVEVSTGLFAYVEETKGRFNNESFQGVWRDIAPDHLAVLREGDIGACSIDDGCGAPRLNRAGEKCSCDGACGKCAPTSLVKPAGSSGGTHDDGENQRAQLLELLRPQWNSLVTAQLSIDDQRIALELALEAADSSNFYVVLAIYDDTFVYANWDGMFQRSYSIDGGGTITLGSEVTSVRPETSFVPVNVTINRNPTMSKSETIEALIANGQTRFTEEDKPFLETLEEAQLAKLMPLESSPTSDPVPDPINDGGEPVDPVDPTPKSTDPAPTGIDPLVDPAPTAMTAAEYLKAAPSEVREVLHEAMGTLATLRKQLIDKIRANEKCPYAASELEVKTTDELRKLATMVAGATEEVNYGGAAGGDITALQQALSSNEPPRVFN